MRKFFILGTAIVVSMAMLMTACKKDDPKPDNGGNNNNQETPGGGGSGGEGDGSEEGWHVYPSTAVVMHNEVTDVDGNSYDAVQIGDQVWMAENLRTTKYADGTSIPMGTTTSTTTAYRYAPGPYQNNEENMDNVARYGYLYNWPAVMHGASSSEANPSRVQGICPDGWHVPSDAEWTDLINYMKTQATYIASGDADHLAKALAATWGWNSSSNTDAPGNNVSTNNATGFSALPAGYYNGRYYYFCNNANLWTTTELNDDNVFYYSLYCSYACVLREDITRDNGFSVRCLRN